MSTANARRRRSPGWVVLSLGWLAVLAGCSPSPDDEGAVGDGGPEPVTGATLKVGLYPYVPRPAQVQQAVAAAWAATEPTVSLEFNSEWDGGYDTDPVALDLDVFVFDAIYLADYIASGVLAPLSSDAISNPADFLPYALAGVRRDAASYWAVPMYGCAAILFYRPGDVALADATTASAVEAAIRDCSYTSKLPPDQRGLMLDMSGGTTSACQYIDAVTSIDGSWPVPLPPDVADLNPTAIQTLRQLIADSSYYNATGDFAPYGRAAAFGLQGVGRAVVGFTESMSAMGAAREQVQFKVMPLGDDTEARPLFYSDVIGVRQGPNAALATRLANLMGSTDVLVAAMGSSDGESPQYLMPARESVFTTLGASDPIYLRMQAMVDDANPRLFALPAGGRDWVSRLKGGIQTDVRRDYPCGCDQNAAGFLDQSTADESCPGVCEAHGGWNGQWRNIPDLGSGVCGCERCPGQDAT